MSAIPYIIRKEFQQIKRNRIMLPMIFILPVIQLIVLSYAADFEVKHLQLAVIDHDRSSASRALIRQFTASSYFLLQGNYFSEKNAFTSLEKNNADLILTIPHGFDKALHNKIAANVQLLFNAINSQKAGIAADYSQQIIVAFNKKILHQIIPSASSRAALNIREAYWYNPRLNYKIFMVPGILAVLVTMLTAFLSSISIIREKEMGTIEQLNVTPITKFEFIVGKLVPFWIIGMFLLGFGLIIAFLVFGITVQGSLLLLFTFCAIYVIAVLGIGLFISTITETQQQAMFITWFFIVIFILLSGLFTPIDSIPQWAKVINIINPVKYFVAVMRMVMLKSSGWKDISQYFLIMGGFAIAYNLLAIINYRKTNQ